MKKILALLLALTMLAALAGCSGGSGSEPAASSEPAAASPAASVQPEDIPDSDDASLPADDEAELPEEAGPIVYEMPLTDQQVTFSFWVEGAPPFIAAQLGSDQSYNTAAVAEYLRDMTNVRIEYTEVDLFTKSEKFNLMIVSGEYPNMIAGFSGLYSGGAEQALADEVIIDLTDMVYNEMPAYLSVLNDYPDFEKEILNDDSQMLYISGFEDESIATKGGVIRDDWLEKVGMDIPETYDEWYEVGKAFKTEFDCSDPFYFNYAVNPGTYFSGGFDLPGFDVTGTGTHFYQIDGQIQSCYVQDNMKDFITMLAQWYSEGLLSRDFYNNTGGGDSETEIFSDQVGVFWSEASYITEYNGYDDLQAKGFHVVGMPNTVMEKGQITHFDGGVSQTNVNAVCITVGTENLDVLAKWLDYQFTEEGQLLNNYGMEGISYYFDEDGLPHYTEDMIHNPDGLNFTQASGSYIHYSAPSLFDSDRDLEANMDELGLAAIEMYNSGSDGAYGLPANMTYTEEETAQLYGSLTDVDTYASEMIMKFVVGELNIDENWDEYVSRLYQLGMQDCIDAQQSALDRYNAR